MKRPSVCLSVACIAGLLFCAYARAQDIKSSDLAGTWYTDDPRALRMQIDSYLESASGVSCTGTLKALILPHAGLRYSGPVAAYGYRLASQFRYSLVIIAGLSHRSRVDGIAVFSGEAWRTPLGTISIDKKCASWLISQHTCIREDNSVFQEENSIELQLPFIQTAIPGARIVPVILSSGEYDVCTVFSEILARLMSARDDVLIIASADMSHYLNDSRTRARDAETLKLVQEMRAQEIWERSAHGEQLFCGYAPVAAVLLACRKSGIRDSDVLSYGTSADSTGDRKRVVGYASIAICSRDTTASDAAYEKENNMLTGKQKKIVLKLARETLDSYLRHGVIPEKNIDDPVLLKEWGAFVTLHLHGRLRGCIGRIVGQGPLYKTIQRMAVQAATADPRFPAVRNEELADIDIEISVLSELEKITDPAAVTMGVHGVVIRKGSSSGVFLPQVADETGWSREEFLTNLCTHKAGLLPDAWRTGEAELYVFTADVFGESNKGD